MSVTPKLNIKQLELLLKLRLIQSKERLEKLKEIESAPDDPSVDKLELVREIINLSGDLNEKA